jgi:hypothetical protein
MLAPEEQAAYLKSLDQVRLASERYLSTHRSPRQVIAFVANLQDGVSRLLATAIEQGVPVACKVGCSHCCNARVEAMPAEIFRIVRELQSRPTEELSRIVQSLQAHVASPNEAAAWSQRRACPFLHDNLCLIYEQRPKACRGAHSLDVSQCRTDAAEIAQDLATVVSTQALSQGSAQAYKNQGFDSAPYELGQAVLMAFSEATAEARWYAGEAVFDSDRRR